MRKPFFSMPENKRVRIFVDTDAACECDDQYAIVHALMTEKVEVMGFIAELFRGEDSMEKSYEEIKKVLKLCGAENVPVYYGSRKTLCREELVPSPGAEAIITEALREDSRPLYVLCQGALTNAAQAVLASPEIASRLVIIYIGGSHYPVGGFDFNSFNDLEAFNAVMESEVPVWMVPEEVYSTMSVGLFELYEKLMPCGEIGKYLVENTVATLERMSNTMGRMQKTITHESVLGFPNGESWSLGDSPAIGLLISHHSGDYEMVDAPYLNPDGSYQIGRFSKKVRMYKNINSAFILQDFFSKMKYHFE